jgi:hypothetical protein
MLIIGGVMVFFGIQEFLVSRGTKSEPVAADLARLEAGDPAPNNFICLNDAVALYPATVYSYKKSKYNNTPPTATTSVNYSFHPVISKSHPFIASLAALAAKHGGLQNIPDTEKVPEIKSFAVLVKTHRFKTIGDIPEGARAEPSIHGMVVNQISSLVSDEENLVKQSFPGIDLTKVLILEEGRQPASLFKSLGLVFGGVGLAGLGIAWFFLGAQQEE